MKVIISCPYSYNFRNYVLSGFVEKLLVSGVSVLLVLPSALFSNEALSSLREKFPGQLSVGEIDQDFSLFRRLVLVFFRAWCFRIQSTKTYQSKKLYIRSVSLVEWLKYSGISVLLPKSKAIYARLLKLLYTPLFKSFKVKDQFIKFDPDLYICTLHNKYNEGKYLFAALTCNVPSVGLIHSWDVITTKGFFPVPSQSTVFWSKANQISYEKYVVPLMGHTRMHTIGIPHFDVYGSPSDRDIAREYLNLPLDKDIILYSTSVKRLVPNEEGTLRKLISDVQECDDVFLFIRIHPQCDRVEFSDIAPLGKNYRVDRPETYDESGCQDKVLFSEQTFSRLQHTISASDVVVNFASSMALDAAALGRPTIWLRSKGSPSEHFYNYEHILEVIDSLDITVVDENDGVLLKALSKIKNTDKLKLRFENEFGSIGKAQDELLKIVLDQCL